MTQHTFLIEILNFNHKKDSLGPNIQCYYIIKSIEYFSLIMKVGFHDINPKSLQRKKGKTLQHYYRFFY